MSSRITAMQAVKMLEDGTHKAWQIIPESQARYYPHAGQANAFFVLCLDNSCTGKVYVVPKGLQLHYSDYDRLLKFLRKKGLPILPKINMNLANFPAQPYSVILGSTYIEGTIKPTGSLSLKSIHSKSPLSYTPGKLANIKYTSSQQINTYLKAWDKVSLIRDSEDGKLTLKVSNSITNQFYDFDVSLEGNVFSVTITLTPTKSVIGGEWTIEGQVSLKITGVIVHTNAMPPPKAQQINKTKLEQQLQMNHSVFYMIGVGVGAIGLGAVTLFSGGADIPLITAAGAAIAFS